jgi:hypothetical protein
MFANFGHTHHSQKRSKVFKGLMPIKWQLLQRPQGSDSSLKASLQKGEIRTRSDLVSVESLAKLPISTCHLLCEKYFKCF